MVTSTLNSDITIKATIFRKNRMTELWPSLMFILNCLIKLITLRKA